MWAEMEVGRVVSVWVVLFHTLLLGFQRTRGSASGVFKARMGMGSGPTNWVKRWSVLVCLPLRYV